jgi:hypothetical protein
MLRSKTTVFGMIAALIVMTGAFTALSANELGDSVTASSTDAFMLVNGHEVREEDYQSRKATVEENVVMLQANAENMPEGNELAESLLDIMETTPPETIALASLILDKALYQSAIDLGHLPDTQQISQQVEQEREIFEMIEADPEEFGVDEASIANYRETVDEIGEDRYWNEFYPQILEQQQAVQSFQMETEQSGEDWIEVQREAFAQADVEISDPDQIAPATISDARNYLDRIWDIYQSQRSRS